MTLSEVPGLIQSIVGYVKCKSGEDAALLEGIPAVSAANDEYVRGRAVVFLVARANTRHDWTSTQSHAHDLILQASFEVQLARL